MNPADNPGTSPAPGQSWDAGLYDGKHAFVWQHGASLVELLAPRAGEKILDLGCGTGRLTAKLAEAGAKVVGIDQAPEMLAQARALYPGIRFERADARDFSFPEPFDAVFSNAVLHWVHEADAAARCVRQALRVGGRFVAELGGRGNVRTIQVALEAAAQACGVRAEKLWYFPSVAEYAAVLERAGLEVTGAVLFDRPTPLQGESGLRDWIAQFAQAVLAIVPPARREEFFRRVEDQSRPVLFRDGTWFADYRRLRVSAIRQS